MKRYSRRSSRSAREYGFTLVELLVSSSIGLLIVAIGLAAFISQRKIVDYDLDRTEVQRSLRSAMEIIGINIRLAGENLSSNFPAIELVDGASGAPDEIVLRRNLMDEVLKLCQDVTNGGNNPVYFGIGGTEPGCIYAEQGQNVSSWTQYMTDVGSPAQAYLYDPATKSGQFFDFTVVNDLNPNSYLSVSAGTPWVTDYFVGQTAAYIVEEWRFRLNGDVLELVENGDTANPLQLAYGLTDMQITIETQDATSYTSFTSTEDWTSIKFVEFQLTGVKERPKGDLSRTLAARFFPRNILSN